MNVAWQGFTCDIPLTQSSGLPLYFSIFTVNLAGTCCSLEYKVNLYIMAWSCLTSAELHSGARCCKVPTLVNCNILHITISTIVPVLLLVTVKATVNELNIIMYWLKWNIITISGKQTIQTDLYVAVGNCIKPVVLVFLMIMNTG